MKQAMVIGVVVGVLSLPAEAHTARLLDEPLPAVAGSPAAAQTAPPLALHFGVSAVAAAVAAPVGLLLAQAVGNLSINLIATAVPALLIMGFFAPTVAALAGWIFGNWNLREGKFGFWLGWGAAVIVNIAAHVIAGFAGVNLMGAVGVILFSVLDGAAMGGAAVGVMHLFRPRPPAPVATIPSFVPGVTDTAFVPLTRTAF